MKKISLLVGAGLAGFTLMVVACSSPTPPQAPVAHIPTNRAPNRSSTPPPVTMAPIPNPPPPVAPEAAPPAPNYTPKSQRAEAMPDPNDRCNAKSLQYLVGHVRTEIPVPLYPSSRRVICSSCVVSDDYVPDRQTIIFSASSGLITAVKCG